MNPTRRPYYRKLRRTIYGVICGLVIWMLGLSYFVSQIPVGKTMSQKPVDAVVVLTASPSHVHQGFLLVAQDLAKEVYIPHVRTKEEQQHLARHKRDKITINYNALAPAAGGQSAPKQYILGNLNYADVIAKWAVDKKITSFRLVANNYHMPRHMREITAALPDSVEVIPAPMFTPGFDISVWLRDSRSRQIVVGEYYRFLISRTQYVINRIESFIANVTKA